MTLWSNLWYIMEGQPRSERSWLMVGHVSLSRGAHRAGGGLSRWGRCRTLAQEGLDGFPRLPAAWAALPPATCHLTGHLRKPEKALTELVGRTSLQSGTAAWPTPRAPEGASPVVSSGFSSLMRSLSASPHVWFCFSFQFNSHFADFPPARAVGPTK